MYRVPRKTFRIRRKEVGLEKFGENYKMGSTVVYTPRQMIKSSITRCMGHVSRLGEIRNAQSV